MDAKKMWKKIGFGVLFVAACFIAMYILMEFHGDVLIVCIAAVLLLIAAFLFLNEVFSDKAKKWAPQEEASPVEEVISAGNGNDGEFRLKITKHMKEMESTQKEMLAVLKNQNILLQSQIENLEHEIYMLSEKQMNQTKSVIKFNKENARQLAISERETLEYVMMELKKAIEDNAGGVPVITESEPQSEPDISAYFAQTPEVMPEAVPEYTPEVIPEAVPEYTPEVIPEAVPEYTPEVAPEASPVAELEEVELEDLVQVSELAGDEEFILPEAEEAMLEESVPEEAVAVTTEPQIEEFDIPEMPEDIDLSELFDIPELMEENISVPEAVEEPAPVAEEKTEEPAADPLAGLGGDPNAMMTPEDIAKLLAAMGQ